ncbi:MAG: hypothetical protein PF445_10555 [Melioribacteraceae bacterium]|nr:hypothetical protein [Melioribacteraceae bacterium]
MKKFIILFTILSLVVIMFSCTLQEDGTGTTPVDPETITLSVTSPKSGDSLFASSSFDIKWSSSTTQKLLLDYTINNGDSWNLIASDLENTQSYIWSPIPNNITSQGRVRVTTADSSLNAISDGFFAILRGTSQTLAVVEPNGGETWQGNSNQAIKWTSIGIDSVNIEYTVDNGLNWIGISINVPSTGFYNWYPLPNNPSTNAKVRVTDASDGSAVDESDNVFTIEPQDLITVTMPNGGEEWLAGSSQYIKWSTNLGITPGSALPADINNDISSKKIGKKTLTSSLSKYSTPINITTSSPKSIESVANVRIDYSINGGANWITLIESTPNNGIYFWTSLPVANSAQCLIRVSDADDGVPFDFNNAAFSIYSTLPQEIIILSPNGNETWAAGTSQEIKWTSKDVSFVKIEYTIDNGVEWNSIIESTPSDGFYTWEQLPTGAATNCRIRISDATDGSPSDMSDNLFSISPEPNINLTSPNGGETLQSGSSINLTWASTNIAEIKIEYTINGGAVWTLIENNVQSTGTYTWENIPDVNSSQVKIKISDADDNMPFDISDNNFSISNQIVQSLEITSPNGGEFWEANTAKNVTWNSSAVTHVKIEFTANNGLDWDVVEDSLASSGSYDWTVPNVNSTQSKIRISDAADSDPIDESNATFRIKQAGTLKLISPASGANWVAGELNRIEWESDNIEKVKIEYTTTNAVYDPTASYFDDKWFSLVTNAPGAVGFYETRFTIPTTEYRLRISDAEFDEPVDFSGLFTVKGQPSYTLELTTPNGGENWIIGEPYEIAWTSENVERVAIDYSINNGTTWNNILTDAPSNGLHNWVVPDMDNRSDLCKIRIKHSTDSTIFDLSDAPFSIHPKDKLLRVVSPNGGESVASGIPTRIEWTSAGVEKVDIFFTIDNTTTWHEIIRNYKSTGAYMWTPPDTSSSLARIKVIDSDDTSIQDESDSYFNIHKADDGTVEVLYPNGGEQLNAGGIAYIQWETQNVKDIKIEYSSNNGADWETLIESTPTDPGSYKWDPIPTDTTQTSHGMIRISDASRSDINDVSNATFTINNSSVVTQTISLVTPNGSEIWVAGESHPINWTSSNIDNVTLEYSVDNGNTWVTITENRTNTGTYPWTVPDEVSTSALVKVKDAFDGNPSDLSNSVFTIKPLPTITLISPNGGETITEGSKEPITWTSQYVQNVCIEFSANNGGSWVELVASTPSDGSWTWDPVSSSISDLCAIKVSDADRNDISEISASTFSIEEQVDQISGEPASIFLVSQSLDAIGVTESGSPETAQITFEVQDSSGTPIDIAHAIDVSFKFGAQPGGGEILAPSLVRTDDVGQVEVNLTSGTIAGAVQIIAEIDFNGNIIRSKPVSIAIHGGLPDDSHFSIGPAQVNYPHLHKLAAVGSITALVGDKYSNPVRPGTAVYFSTEAGVVQGSGLTDEFGRTTVTLLSGDPQPNDPTYGPGFFYVTGETIDENDVQITTKTRVLYSGYPYIVIAPQAFNIADGGSQTFTYSVMDENGNPLAPGNTYSVAVQTDGDAAVSGDVSILMPDVQTGNTSFSFTLYDSKPGEITAANATVTVTVNGPNGTASASVGGTVE